MSRPKCNLCEGCRLNENPFVPGRGNDEATIMIVQDNPRKLDIKHTTQFYGKSCRAFLQALRNRGIPEDEVYFTSIAKCGCDEDDEIKPKDVVNCLPSFEEELAEVDPDIIIPMGKASLKKLIGKNTLTKLRGKAQTVEVLGRERIILPMIHPINTKTKPIYKEYTLKDLDTLASLYENGMPELINTDYRFPDSLEEALKEIEDFKENSEVLSFDLETTSLNPFEKDSKIICISLSNKPTTGVAIPIYHKENPMSEKEIKVLIQSLKELLETPDIIKVAHNGKFDIKWLEVTLGIEVKNFSFDTQLAHYLAVSEEQGTQGLKSLAWEFTDMGGYDNSLDEFKKTLPESQRHNYGNIPWDVLKEYAVADADCTIRLYEIFKKLIDKNEQWKVLLSEILMPASYALKDVEINGMKFDKDLGKSYTEQYSEEIKRITLRLEEYPEVLELVRERQVKWLERESIKTIPKKLRTDEETLKFNEYAKYKDPTFNWNSVNQLRELFFEKLGLTTSIRTDKGELSTNVEAIEEMSTQHEIPKLLGELRKITTLNGMFIDKFPDLVDENGYVHSSFNLTGTVTGRLSSDSPNFQQIPRKVEDPRLFQYHHEVKSLFTSRYGQDGCIMNADYSALEMRIAGVISGDPVLYEAFKSGKDLHKSTASLVWGVPFDEVSKTLRGRAKAVYYRVNTNK